VDDVPPADAAGNRQTENVKRREIGMAQDRRDFIKRFGVTLGSLIVSGSLPGCGPRKKEGASDAEDGTKTTPRAPQWEELRQCWVNLKTLNEEIDEVTKQNKDLRATDCGAYIALKDAIPKKRAARHEMLLETLVTTGELDRRVADHMQTAFEEAIYHIVRSGMLCYIAIPFEHGVRQDLLRQSDVLSEISGDVDPATVAKAQAAIAQDAAFFEIFRTNPIDCASLEKGYKDRALKASPEALEAARLLTQLFLEKRD